MVRPFVALSGLDLLPLRKSLSVADLAGCEMFYMKEGILKESTLRRIIKTYYIYITTQYQYPILFPFLLHSFLHG